MKKFSILLFLVLIVSSCEIPYEPPTSNDSIVGEWNLVSNRIIADAVQQINNPAGGADVVLTSHWEITAFDIDVTAVFSENQNTYTSTGTISQHTVMTGVLTLPDGTETPMNQSGDETGIVSSDNGTWSLDANQLTLTLDNISSVFDVTELTDVSLKFNGYVPLYFTLPDLNGGIGAQQEILVHIFYEFTR